jgi:outer membrane protein
MKLTKRLNRTTKHILIVGIWSATLTTIYGQTLEDCHLWAINASAATSQSEIVEKVRQLNNQNFRSGNLPMIQLDGKASYQSEVFTLPFSFPGTDTPEIPKDQYNVALNVQQKIYDGGVSKRQQSITQAESDLRIKELDASKEKIRPIINELYFGILQSEAQLTLQETLLTELENRLKTARAGLSQGILLASSIRHLEKEKLKIIQLQTSLQLRNQAMRASLSDWTEEDLMQAKLSFPTYTIDPLSPITRKELAVFDQKQRLLDLQAELVETQMTPKLYAYGNVGYGQPNPFNFFETNWDGYYLIGAKLQWQIWDWGKTRRNKQILGLQGTGISSEKTQFLKQINQQKQLVLSEIQQLESQLTIDNQLVQLQQEILDEASLRLDEGTLSQSDYISELNSLNQIKSQQINHQVQLCFQQTKFLTLTGQL